MLLNACYFGVFPPWITQGRPHIEGFAPFALDWLSAHLGFSYEWKDIDLTPVLTGELSVIGFYQDAVRTGMCDLALASIDAAADFVIDDSVAHTINVNQ